MTNEQMIAWLRCYAKFAVYLSEEEMLNEIADRIEALCRAIEQHEADKAAHAATVEGILNSHEAFRQEVSDAVEAYNDLWRNRTPGRDEFMGHFRRFVLPKPDPLVEDFGHDLAADIRAAIEKRGGRVVWGEG